MKYKYYNPRLKNYSNQNRNNGTKSEVCLWKHVLSRGFSAWEVLNRIADVSIIIGEWLDEHYKGELPVPRSGKKNEIE